MLQYVIEWWIWIIAGNNLTQELEDRLLGEITNGQYQPHQKLLPLRKLVERFGCKPNRVQRVVQSLTRKGYLYTKPGCGTFVSGAESRTMSRKKTAQGRV